MAVIGVSYRRGSGQVDWHYCQNCSRWPVAGYEECDGPPGGDLCQECHVLDRAGGCTYLARQAAEPPYVLDHLSKNSDP